MSDRATPHMKEPGLGPSNHIQTAILMSHPVQDGPDVEEDLHCAMGPYVHFGLHVHKVREAQLRKTKLHETHRLDKQVFETQRLVMQLFKTKLLEKHRLETQLLETQLGKIQLLKTQRFTALCFSIRALTASKVRWVTSSTRVIISSVVALSNLLLAILHYAAALH